MEVPLYEDLQAYIRNPGVFGVAGMITPLLIEVGDSDATVFFHQGVELYNIARRAKKDVVLIEYAGEDHGLRNEAKQIDYQRRIFVPVTTATAPKTQTNTVAIFRIIGASDDRGLR